LVARDVTATFAPAAARATALAMSLAVPTQAKSLSLLNAIVIGGLGSLSGAVLGSFVLVYLPVWTGGFASSLNLASNVANNVPLAVYGIVLIVAILVFPRGIAGGVGSTRRAMARMVRSRRGPSTLPAAPTP